jgi:hypothetical protein
MQEKTVIICLHVQNITLKKYLDTDMAINDENEFK